MNLSTRLCDLTAGEYLALTQGAGAASSLLWIVLGAAAVLLARRVRRWWLERPGRKVQPLPPFHDEPCDAKNLGDGLRCDLGAGHPGDHGAWSRWQRDEPPAAERATPPTEPAWAAPWRRHNCQLRPPGYEHAGHRVCVKCGTVDGSDEEICPGPIQRPPGRDFVCGVCSTRRQITIVGQTGAPSGPCIFCSTATPFTAESGRSSDTPIGVNPAAFPGARKPPIG